MTPEQIAIRQHLSKPEPYVGVCSCMWPQGDDPLCPCAMNWCEKVEGQWYKIIKYRSSDGITYSAEKVVL